MAVSGGLLIEVRIKRMNYLLVRLFRTFIAVRCVCLVRKCGVSITNAEFKSILEFEPMPGNPVMAVRHFEMVDHMLLHYEFVPSCFSCKIEKAVRWIDCDVPEEQKEESE